MARTLTEAELLRLLEHPEIESLEFKGTLLSAKAIAEYAVGIGNAGGGHLILGVHNETRVPTGLPQQGTERLQRMQREIHDCCDNRVGIAEYLLDAGCLVVITIPGRQPGMVFRTVSGKFLIRSGESNRPLTIEELNQVQLEGGRELTRQPVQGTLTETCSPAAFESLRLLMQEAGATAELIRRDDAELLEALGLWDRTNGLRLAGLLLVGRSEAIQEYLPHAGWGFLRMGTDTRLHQRVTGTDGLVIALDRLRSLVEAHNPITTLPGWLIRPEIPVYPKVALRELIVNAFVHRDYQQEGRVDLKLFPGRLELSNPGQFIGGITAQNILHHPSRARYPTLMNALQKMRLAEGANVGLPRIYRDFLQEGKEAPEYHELSSSVVVTAYAQEPSEPFLHFLSQQESLDVDHLIIIHYLIRHREITVSKAASLCHRTPSYAKEPLSYLADRRQLLERCGSGRGLYYRFSQRAYKVLLPALSYVIDARLQLEHAKARVLSALRFGPLKIQDVREITQLSTPQARQLMKSLRQEGVVKTQGTTKATIYILSDTDI